MGQTSFRKNTQHSAWLHLLNLPLEPRVIYTSQRSLLSFTHLLILCPALMSPLPKGQGGSQKISFVSWQRQLTLLQLYQDLATNRGLMPDSCSKCLTPHTHLLMYAHKQECTRLHSRHIQNGIGITHTEKTWCARTHTEIQ